SADPDVGDPGAIEESLTGPPPSSQPVQAPEPTTETTTGTDSPCPLWEPNEKTSFADLAETSPTPVGLSIPVIDVEAPIDPYGVDRSSGLMDVPDNVTDVAWYEHGPSPGESGSAVLAAHVDLRNQGPGVFFELGDLEPGDLVEVSFDDGTQQSFEVTASATYPKVELPLDAVFSRSGPAVLTLITCGGIFDAESSRYDSNVVVYATPVSPSAPSVTD
ncbi:MAG TPA: class F sortase, partial [Acidimicrobiia bacterium]|nr:class F sortase [Acidimicrobiia bacterium]